MTPRLIFLAFSPRVAPGQLTWQAWETLRSAGRVLTGSAEHPQLPYVRAAGVTVEVTEPDAAALVSAAVSAASGDEPGEPGRERTPGGPGQPYRAGTPGAANDRQGRPGGAGAVVWLADPEGAEDLLREVGAIVVGPADGPEIEVVQGAYDLPGARVLDLVAVMETLRRECPWDRKQTHASLAPYLLEEAYEVVDTIDGGDLAALPGELGDVLLQVAFHAEMSPDFTIDDVAEAIVTKLVRRHPHVFGDVEVADAEEVSANWDRIKSAERGAEASIFQGVPMAQPALSLAGQLQRRAARAGVPEETFGDDGPGADLFALVRGLLAEGRDPEAELRAAAQRFRARVEQRPGAGADPET